MDSRGFGLGFSSWGESSSSRGSGSYDLYGYKDSMSGGGAYGGGGFGGSGGGGQMKSSLSGAPLLSATRTNADDVIAKINQRLDVLAQLEGGVCGGRRRDRFDQYESYDSRSSALGPRDLYSSGNYGYGDSRGDVMAQRGGMGFGAMGGAGGGGGFDGLSSYGPAQMRQVRDAFSGSSWGAGQISPQRGGAQGGHGFGRWQDSSSVGGGGGRNGGQGPSPSGRGKLPSLLAHRMYPESGAYQPQHGSQDYPVRHFGGGQRANRKRTRKRPLNRQQQVKPQPEVQKKRKQSLTAADEPESKMGKTELAGEDAATCEPSEQKVEWKKPCTPATVTTQAAEEKTTGLSIKEEIAQLRMKLQDRQLPRSADTDCDAADQGVKKETLISAMVDSECQISEAEGECSTLSIEEELSHLKAKLQSEQTPLTDDKPKKRRGFFEMSGIKITARRISFACSICKFRSFYSEDMVKHLESKFHKDHFKFLSNELSKHTMDFLQEYLNIKHKKMENTLCQITNHSAAICQVLKEQDLTRDIGMEHFMRKVEAAHCAACDMYIPMQYNLIQKHLRSPDHNYNRKYMMEESKRSGLSVARSILNHKIIRKKLESYLKNENPFPDDQEDQDPEDPLATEDMPEAGLPNESQKLKTGETGSAGDGAEPAAEAVENGKELERNEEHKPEDVKVDGGVKEEELVEEEDEKEGVDLGEEELGEGLADL
ncbi:A-kinase anchor protein 8-like isoform X1 [Electrophorus electricus]|uniref:A-kinase anchor protein 8-like isoform X1 n=1 Tax=Electrophorus electricus TaxID=8005 RepID=UPI0015D088F1|nr:A-kinase anchor protein 8-like isoform X1 [Electrophorus electricus]